MILCGTDLGPSGEAAARWAAALARTTGQPLRLVHVDDADHQNLDAFPESVREAAAALHGRLDERRADHESVLQHLAASLGLETEHGVLSGRPWEALVDHAAEISASMLVVGPHLSGLGSTSRRVATHAPCPVLVCGEGEPPDFANVSWVVGVAHDHRVAALLRDVGSLAARTGGGLIPTRVFPRIPDDAPSETQALLAEVDQAARAEIEHLSADLGVAVSPHVASGTPATVLLEEARNRGAGLAIAAHSGKRPRDTLRRFFLGSVTERVIRDAKGVPIFVSPAEGDE